jgi:hypothetical protein
MRDVKETDGKTSFVSSSGPVRVLGQFQRLSDIVRTKEYLRAFLHHHTPVHLCYRTLRVCASLDAARELAEIAHTLHLCRICGRAKISLHYISDDMRTCEI